MRLTQSQVNSIKSLADSVFGDCKVYLFGSRASDEKRGGDIDLLIQTSSKGDLLSKRLSFKSLLKQEIGDQKIDVITRDPGHIEKSDVVYQEALKGILL